MTLYYSLVFLLLVFEMTLFMTLIVPMPFTWKRRLFTFLSENPLIAKLQYWLKIVFVFVLILFIDSVNRVYRVQIELTAAGKEINGVATTLTVGADRSEVQARKFYSQRNMYLCGFTLFLSLILNRTYIMILDVLRLEEENKKIKGEYTGSEKGSEKLANAGGSGEISKLKNENARLQKELEAMKKQSEGLSAEYNRLGDQITPADSTPKKDR